MQFHSWPDHRLSVLARRRAPRVRTRSPRSQKSAGHQLSLELLEDRSLLSVAPLPIPGGFANPFPGEPFVHLNLPGPADSLTTSAGTTAGNEPSLITNFDGFVGVAHFQGTGSDRAGNSLLWDADLRFMQGVYQGVDGSLHQGTFAFV
jgi:hypothetical protein